MAKQEKINPEKSILITHGSAITRNKATVSDNSVKLHYDPTETDPMERIRSAGFFTLDGKAEYYSMAAGANIGEHVQIEGRKEKIFTGDYPRDVRIIGRNGEVVIITRDKEAYLQDLVKLSLFLEPSKLEQAVFAEPLTPPAQKEYPQAAAAQGKAVAAPKISPVEEGYAAEPSPEQLQQLVRLINEAREEGHAKARLEIEALEYEANAVIDDLNTKLGQKEQDYNNIARLAERLVAAAYARGMEILKNYGSSMKTMEEMCRGHRKIIEENKAEASELSGKISRLENEISGIKKSSAEESKGAEELKRQIKELQKDITVLDSENRLYDRTQKEIEAQMKELQEAKEALEIEYNASRDNFREETESVKRKRGEEIKGYQEMLVKERGILSKIYGRMARLAGLEPGAHPRQSFSVIELYLLQRQNLLKEVEGLRKAITQHAEKASAKYAPEGTGLEKITAETAQMPVQPEEPERGGMYLKNEASIKGRIERLYKNDAKFTEEDSFLLIMLKLTEGYSGFDGAVIAENMSSDIVNSLQNPHMKNDIDGMLNQIEKDILFDAIEKNVDLRGEINADRVDVCGFILPYCNAGMEYISSNLITWPHNKTLIERKHMQFIKHGYKPGEKR